MVLNPPINVHLGAENDIFSKVYQFQRFSYMIDMIMLMNCTDESRCAGCGDHKTHPTRGFSHLRQVNVPACISYDTFYKALQFTYCGEVDPNSPVPNSPDLDRKV